MCRACHVYLSEGGIVNDHHHVIINMIMITIISSIMAIRGKVYYVCAQLTGLGGRTEHQQVFSSSQDVLQE